MGMREFDQVVRELESVSVHGLLHRARAAVVVGSIPSRADGFPKRTPGNGDVGGGKGGRLLMSITSSDDPEISDDEPDRVPTSSTEVAALARDPLDVPARLAGQVNRHVHQLASVLAQLEAALRQMDVVRATTAVPDPPMCWLAKQYDLPFDLRWHVGIDADEKPVTTDFGTVLDKPLDQPQVVCAYVYKFVRNHRRLPLKAEMQTELRRTPRKAIR